MELALALPVLITLLLAGVQVLLVARAQLAVTHAAREGARAASVAAQPRAAADHAARAGVTLDDLRARLSVSTATGNHRVRVVVRARVPTDVPLVGALIGDVTVSAESTMATEG